MCFQAQYPHYRDAQEAEEALEKEMNSQEPPGWIAYTYHAMVRSSSSRIGDVPPLIGPQVAWAKGIMSEDKDDLRVAFARMDKARENMQKVKSYKVPDAKDTPLQQAYVLAGKLVRSCLLVSDVQWAGGRRSMRFTLSCTRGVLLYLCLWCAQPCCACHARAPAFCLSIVCARLDAPSTHSPPTDDGQDRDAGRSTQVQDPGVRQGRLQLPQGLEVLRLCGHLQGAESEP